MFTREHLIIGAAGFVLGGIVATASITVVLSTQKQEPAVAAAPVTPAAPVIAAPDPASTPPAAAAPATPVPPTPAAPVSGNKPGISATSPDKPAAEASRRPIAKQDPAPIPAPLAAEEADRQSEEARQIAARKQALESQVSDSAEIIRLKAQQIREMEERLKSGH
ncbi:MAG: hypothetical protein Q7T36_13585 [Fluviicoccus sp.]|uniref:hypothetical protein n=1 Tax=Fluviicoccus sp. TaxID=2003552 RepID=UPI00271A225C|nr:hypothetical protein [Fluviicoccus sp.]MDO8331491.1 hypothetical protein [Fluviicoccus sp.]